MGADQSHADRLYLQGPVYGVWVWVRVWSMLYEVWSMGTGYGVWVQGMEYAYAFA